MSGQRGLCTPRRVRYSVAGSRAGRLPFSKTPGGQYRFLRSDVEALLAPQGGEAA